MTKADPAPFQVLSRSRKSGHLSFHPFGGYFGVPLRATTSDAKLAYLLRQDVQDALGPGYDVWVQECEKAEGRSYQPFPAKASP